MSSAFSPNLRIQSALDDFLLSDYNAVLKCEFPMPLPLIDSVTEAKITETAAKLRLILIAYTRERESQSFTVRKKSLLRFLGLEANPSRIEKALKLLLDAVWKFSATSISKSDLNASERLLKGFSVASKTVNIEVSDIHFSQITKPVDGYAYVCIRTAHQAQSLHEVAFLPVASFWQSMAGRRSNKSDDLGAKYYDSVLTVEDFKALAMCSAKLSGSHMRRDVFPRLFPECSLTTFFQDPDTGDLVFTSVPSVKTFATTREKALLDIRPFVFKDVPRLQPNPMQVIRGLRYLQMPLDVKHAKRLHEAWILFTYLHPEVTALEGFSAMCAQMKANRHVITKFSVEECAASYHAYKERLATLPRKRERKKPKPKTPNHSPAIAQNTAQVPETIAAPSVVTQAPAAEQTPINPEPGIVKLSDGRIIKIPSFFLQAESAPAPSAKRPPAAQVRMLEDDDDSEDNIGKLVDRYESKFVN